MIRESILIALLAAAWFGPGSDQHGRSMKWLYPASDPDTLDWHGYFPLQVGNLWQYDIHECDLISEADWIRQWRIVAETTHGVEPWFVLEARCVTIDVSDPYFDPCTGFELEHRLIRYDEDRASLRVLWLAPDGTYRDAPLYRPEDIALDMPFDTTQVGNEGEYHFYRENEARLSNDTVIPTTVKAVHVESAVPGARWFAHGIGFLASVGGEGGETTIRLRFASVGGETWGRHFPVAIESPPELPSAIVALEVYPNPATGQVAVAIDLGRATSVTARLVDGAGRLVRSIAQSRMLPTGSSTMTVGISDLAPGVYLVDVTAGSSRENRTIVLHR